MFHRIVFSQAEFFVIMNFLYSRQIFYAFICGMDLSNFKTSFQKIYLNLLIQFSMKCIIALQVRVIWWEFEPYCISFLFYFLIQVFPIRIKKRIHFVQAELNSIFTMYGSIVIFHTHLRVLHVEMCYFDQVRLWSLCKTAYRINIVIWAYEHFFFFQFHCQSHFFTFYAMQFCSQFTDGGF